MEGKFFQIGGTTEDREGGSSQHAGLTGLKGVHGDTHSEDAKEGKWSGIDIREGCDECPIGKGKFEMSDLSSVRGEQCHCSGRKSAGCDYVQRGPFCTLEHCCHIVLVLHKQQLGP